MHEGTFFYIKEQEEFFVYQFLREQENECLVSSYWPVVELPDFEKMELLDLRTACTAIHKPMAGEIKELGWVPLSEKQQTEIEQFLKIRSSKLIRSEHFQLEFNLAQEHYTSGKFQECIDILTEIAPYNKLFMDLYRLRGLANHALGDQLNALYDLNYYAEQHPNPDPEIIELIRTLDTIR